MPLTEVMKKLSEHLRWIVISDPGNARAAEALELANDAIRDAGTMTDEINDAAKDIVAVFMHPADLGFEDVLQATRSRISKVVGILPTTHNPEETTT